MIGFAQTEKGEAMEDKLAMLPFMVLVVSNFILFFILDYRLDRIERKIEERRTDE